MEFIDNKTIEDFSRDGAVLCKGMFIDWLDELRIGVDKLIENSESRKNLRLFIDGEYSDEFIYLNSNQSIVKENDTHFLVLNRPKGRGCPFPWLQDLVHHP